ncbi:MAG: serine/threonine-protein kinase [Isosphaeraceae bacterium]
MNERDLFIEALQKGDAGRRREYLLRACGANHALLERVEGLLRVHESADQFLESPPSPPTIMVEPPKSSEVPCTTIGPYKLLEPIGEGGMGVVYLAEQAEPVRRKVALKVIKPGMDSRQVVARFEAERQALAMMDHPNLAKVLDGGMTEQGRPYFVMELVRGLPITEYCDRELLSINERLELFVLVCRAVQHAHQKGIIHRELQPSNVLVTVIDSVPTPKVIDFGVAKATGQALTDRTLFTGFHQFVGTPLYVSPEQADPSSTDVDTRSDIYSLGVLLYELLVGTTPFDSETLKQAAFDEMRRIIREEDPPKPSTRLSTLGERRSTVSVHRKADVRRLDRTIRGELDWIVMKALEKDRRRYDTANDFAADVMRYLTDQPVEACPPSLGYRLRKFMRRNRGPLAAGLALASLLVAGAAGTSIGLVRALRAEARAKEEAAVATAVRDFFTDDLLGQSLSEKRARDRSVSVEELLRRAADHMAGKFARHSRVEAEIRLAIGDSYAALGDFRAAHSHLQRACGLGRSALGDEHPRTLEFQNHLLIIDEKTERMLDVAVTLTEESLETRRRVLGREHPDTIASMVDLGRMYVRLRQLDRAEPLLLESLDAGRRVVGPDDSRVLSCMESLIQGYDLTGRPDRAEALRVASLAARGGVQGRIEFSVGTPYHTRCRVHDDGTGLQALPFPQEGAYSNRPSPSARDDYPGGRQYLYPANNSLRVWSEGSGQNKAVTNFQAPYVINFGSNLWSNDGLDSFVSFFLYNGTTGLLSIYRAHVSAADLASASYQPITLGDPRLERVMDWPSGQGIFYWWNHDGSGFYYPDPRDKTKVRLKLVGSGLSDDVDPVVCVAPVELTELRVIPPADPLDPVSDRYLVASALPIGTGILAMDLQTSTWWWLATQAPSIDYGIRGPCFSPDGSMVEFGNTRTVTTGTGKKAKRTFYFGVYEVPFFGGPVTRVTETSSTTNLGYVTVNNWNTP